MRQTSPYSSGFHRRKYLQRTLSFETMYNDDFLRAKLDERREQNAFRTLRLQEGKVDFCSNDYLGIVKNGLLENLLPGASTTLKHGSTGSRLLAGNYTLIEETEKELAAFHQSEAALIFNSGYDANVGLLSSVPQKGDTILYDQLIHASIRDGIRLSFAQAFSFKHNDVNDLANKLEHTTGNVFVVTESVFSMDGDLCSLNDIMILCQHYKAHLIIDEAHAIGVIGEKGEGVAQHLNLHNQFFARVYTFGKACGCHGAVIAGSQQLRDYLINFARSFIFSTSLPEVAVAAIRKSYSVFPSMQEERSHLLNLIQLFKYSKLRYETIDSETAIQAVLVEGNTAVKQVADLMQQNNLDIRAILYPSVPKGKERLRIVLHAFNTVNEVEKVIELLNS